ncbi:MAG: hypothetical protein JJ896_14275 [Rhodothermales bacterium]|nr:hypothetical protein [Rhodothermales bacterium]MBO6780816.1 hypothetical protein [Rhodothermales bacterium]
MRALSILLLIALTLPAKAEDPASQGFLYGRVTTDDGQTYEGRLRFGGDEEAFWSEYFNGRRVANPWREFVSDEAIEERRALSVFGYELFDWTSEPDLSRPFMVPFGDIARIQPSRTQIRVVMKSGSVAVLDRFEADDLADGVRVWDSKLGIVDIGEWDIELIEFLPTPVLENLPHRMYGVVKADGQTFSGYVQWNREKGVSDDYLHGISDRGEVSLRFDRIESIARRGDGGVVTTRDGRDLLMTEWREPSAGKRGIYVNDERFGRVLVSWEALEDVQFSMAGSGPAFHEFAGGHELRGTVLTAAGNRITGRVVFDMDEAESTATLDAPIGGVDYTVPFSMIASLEVEVATVAATLASGEELRLEREGDLADYNLGVLVFVDGQVDAEYVPWKEVASLRFESGGAH